MESMDHVQWSISRSESLVGIKIRQLKLPSLGLDDVHMLQESVKSSCNSPQLLYLPILSVKDATN